MSYATNLPGNRLRVPVNTGGIAMRGHPTEQHRCELAHILKQSGGQARIHMIGGGGGGGNLFKLEYTNVR